MDIRKLSGDTFAVLLDRDGKQLRYEFRWRPSTSEVLPGYLDFPDRIQWDLMDYEVIPPPGRPHGAIWIPAFDDVCRAVYRVAHGKHIDFPIVLDER